MKKLNENVEDGEYLRRRVKKEWIHLATGRPTEAAFRKEDLMFPDRGGVSVNRSTEDEAHRARHLPDGWPASVDANTGSLREILDQEGAPAFQVDATPTPDNANHASIIYAAALRPDAHISPLQARRARRLLLAKFKRPGFGQNIQKNPVRRRPF